ncbi:MAG: hypothetical protein JO345_24785 [Streptosporangiaceae bacterium]|nr:hypothetical protein [Streptosporangiaceae bacterium]
MRTGTPVTGGLRVLAGVCSVSFLVSGSATRVPGPAWCGYLRELVIAGGCGAAQGPPISLYQVTVRYWFTRDGGAGTVNATCQYAQVGCSIAPGSGQHPVEHRGGGRARRPAHPGDLVRARGAEHSGQRRPRHLQDS